MIKKDNFIQHINEGYTSKEESIILGAVILDVTTVKQSKEIKVEDRQRTTKYCRSNLLIDYVSCY
jgi:hypothetical protein